MPEVSEKMKCSGGTTFKVTLASLTIEIFSSNNSLTSASEAAWDKTAEITLSGETAQVLSVAFSL